MSANPAIFAIHQTAMAVSFKTGKRAVDCSVCRHAETHGREFHCKRGLPMVAASCTDFRDARRPCPSLA